MTITSREGEHPASDGEPIVPGPSTASPVVRVKSTLLLSSVSALRAAGYLGAYEQRLDPAFRDETLGSVAGAWIPLAAAMAHYRACDAIGLSPEKQLELGRKTGADIRAHLTRFAGAVSREMGVTPWTVFEYFPRFWARAFDGGAVSIQKRGPKEAIVLYANCALLESAYFRNALRGVALGLLKHTSRSAFMSELSHGPGLHHARYRTQWV